MANRGGRPRKTPEKPPTIKPRKKGVFGAALYMRVSTPNQSHRSQLRALREFCKQKGWDVLVEVKDVASGATVRPRRDALIEAARRKHIDAIVCFKLDRWGRSTSDLVASLEELTACGCAFVSVTDAIDMTTPSGRALAGMLAVFAGFERDLIQERVRAGLDAAREKGVKLGRPTLPDDKVERVRELRATGLSQRAIAKELGIGNGSVARILAA